MAEVGTGQSLVRCGQKKKKKFKLLVRKVGNCTIKDINHTAPFLLKPVMMLSFAT